MDDLIEHLNSLSTMSRAIQGGILFVLLNAAFVPATFLSVACGFFLPLPLAIVLASLSRSATAFFCSFCARYFLRKTILQRIKKDGKVARIESALRSEGCRGVILLRLSPIFPSGPSNYVLGLTTIPLWSIALGTLIGTFPNTLLCTLGGAGLGSISQVGSWTLWDSTYGLRLLAVGIFATMGLLWQIRRRIRRLEKSATEISPETQKSHEHHTRGF